MQDPPQRLTVTVTEAAKLLGISRGLAYTLVRTGEIRSIRLGRRLLVPRQVIDQLLHDQDRDPSGPTNPEATA